MRSHRSRFTPLLLGALIVAGFTANYAQSKGIPTAGSAEISDELPSMPESVTSFGAVTSEGWLYVYGGHKGKRHEYSAEMVSGSFHRLKLNGGGGWERLPGSAPGQGLPLVEHGGYIYRTGGMAAQNAADAEQQLFSTSYFERFNLEQNRWEKLFSLPEPRSSHDAVVIGNNLYVVGGWNLTGHRKTTEWHSTALVLDLTKPEAGWTELPQPFKRRALAVAALGSKLFCIGGMDSDSESTLAVDIYDTTTGLWSKGPELPPGKHKGFSCSAIAQDGKIYASSFKGDLLRLSQDHTSWEAIETLQHRRMSHRLVRAGARELIALGGEDGAEKRPELEILTLAEKPVATTSIAN